MAPDRLMVTAVRLGASVDALAALAAYARLETEQLPADPRCANCWPRSLLRWRR
jgi:hypothetical protein